MVLKAVKQVGWRSFGEEQVCVGGRQQIELEVAMKRSVRLSWQQ